MANDALGNSLNLVEMLFERMPMGIAVLDQQYRILRYNPTWEDFSAHYAPPGGAPLTSGVGYFEHIPGVEETILPLFEKALGGETVRQNSVLLQAGALTTYWDVVLTPLAENGQINGILVVSTDVTERVRLRQNLEQLVAERTHELARRKEAAESLRDILSVLNSERPPREIFAYLTQRSAQLLNADASILYRVDGVQLTHEAEYNFPEALSTLKPGQIYPGEANQRIQNREPVLISDARVYLDQLLVNAALDESQRRWYTAIRKNYQSYLGVPLIVRNQFFGGLILYFKNQRAFSEEDLHLSLTLGEQAALAIENARLFEKAEEAAIAAERNRLARDLHDAVTQTLFSASMIADVLPKIFERNPEEGQRRLVELRQLTRGALSEMRTLLVELRPAALVDIDLGDLLGHQINAFMARTRLAVSFERHCAYNPPPEIKEAFYRITQEAFNNIAKHADAAAVTVQLDCQPAHVELSITDDGAGFDPTASSEGLGLNIMAERARNAGAQLEIHSQPGQGTCLEMRWSVKAEST